jgi:hypothetical protein
MRLYALRARNNLPDRKESQPGAAIASGSNPSDRGGFIVSVLPNPEPKGSESTRHRVNRDGYVEVFVLRRWRLEHIVVAERKIGRPLTDEEVVHHRNGNKTDNRPENLSVMTRAEHARFHALDREYEKVSAAYGADEADLWLSEYLCGYDDGVLFSSRVLDDVYRSLRSRARSALPAVASPPRGIY